MNYNILEIPIIMIKYHVTAFDNQYIEVLGTGRITFNPAFSV